MAFGRILILILVATMAPLAHAKKTKPKNPIAKALYVRPNYLLTDEQFYSKYFGRNDGSLKETYKKPENLPYAESDRSNLANGVLRARLRSTFETYMREMSPPEGVKRVQKGIEEAKNYAIPVGKSKKGGPSSHFVVGYDVFTDASKFEYLGGVFETGVYHSAFSKALTNGGWSSASLNVNTNLGVSVPRTEFSYPLNGEYLQTTVRKKLSDSLDAAISKKQPIHMPDYQHFYEFRLQYNF